MIKQSDVDTRNFNRNLICIKILGIIFIIFFTILITSTYKNIIKFIEQFKALMGQAENGDLTIKAEIYKKSEVQADITNVVDEATTTNMSNSLRKSLSKFKV